MKNEYFLEALSLASGLVRSVRPMLRLYTWFFTVRALHFGPTIRLDSRNSIPVQNLEVIGDTIKNKAKTSTNAKHSNSYVIRYVSCDTYKILNIYINIALTKAATISVRSSLLVIQYIIMQQHNKQGYKPKILC